MNARTLINAYSMIALVGALSIVTSSAQPIDSVASLKNRAVAASPRAKEAFPWLLRTGTPAPQGSATLVEIRKNRALAVSPRMLEAYPELLRRTDHATALKKTGADPMAAVIKNRALAASPRTREEFPALARGLISQKDFQMAPLK
jgi:hypothetical protein